MKSDQGKITVTVNGKNKEPKQTKKIRIIEMDGNQPNINKYFKPPNLTKPPEKLTDPEENENDLTTNNESKEVLPVSHPEIPFLLAPVLVPAQPKPVHTLRVKGVIVELLT